MATQLIECVPNFSEGCDQALVRRIRDAIAAHPGILLLDVTLDSDHNRSVITYVGPPASVVNAAVSAASEAARLIDLRKHKGVHPRIGALDVLPFVPLEGATLEDCVQLAHTAGQRIWDEAQVPSYFYEAAATRPGRLNLEDVRRGQFERLKEDALRNPARRPDVGGPGLHPTAGAVAVGARKFLIAVNVILNTPDATIAIAIAQKIRTSSGGLPNVKALGLALASRGLSQVSMNLTDYEVTPMHVVHQAIVDEAKARGVKVLESELIGLIPRGALEAAGTYDLRIGGFHEGMILENRLAEAARRGSRIEV